MENKNQKIAYEFKDNVSLKYFLNNLSLRYEDLDLSGLHKDSLFGTASNEHPVYVVTTLSEPVYTLTDHLSDDVEVVNEDNARTFLNSLER